MRTLLVLSAVIASSLISAAKAEQAVKIGNAYALLNVAPGATAGAVLIPGGDGQLGVQPDGSFSSLRNNQLVRTRKQYLAHGVTTLTIDRGVDVAAAVRHLKTLTKRVAVVATSRGSLRVAGSLGASPNSVVLTAAFLDSVRSAVGSPSRLPRTLVVHHRKDGCKHTPPGAVDGFKTWGGAKVSVAWFDGGSDVGNPCHAKAYHGFNGLDGAVVSRIAAFARGG